MEVQLFYFDGCPSYEQALANVNDALRAEGLPETVEMVPVISDEDAQAKSFLGSPTIRVDGADLEGADADAGRYGCGCRVYEGDGGNVGWPSVARVRQSLQRARRASG